jgi:hypothetical protein
MTTQTIGSRRQVWNGTAKRTSGGLTKSDLMMSHGRIVSKSKHFSAKKEMRLLKYGYGSKKGKFGYVKIRTKKNRKGHRRMKGGMMHNMSPANADSSYMIKDAPMPDDYTPLDHALVGGRRHRRRMMGGSGHASLSPANVDSSYMIKDVMPDEYNPLDRALVGGMRRRRKHRMRGGTTNNRLMPASLDSNNLQLEATNY